MLLCFLSTSSERPSNLPTEAFEHPAWAWGSLPWALLSLFLFLSS